LTHPAGKNLALLCGPRFFWPENPMPPALVVTILISQGDGKVVNKTRAFGAFQARLACSGA
jgi:hypothetical protein